MTDRTTFPDYIDRDIYEDSLIERVAAAIEEAMFAPHELPLDRDLHAKYLNIASEAIAVVRQYDAGK